MPKILVADDSIAVRKVAERLLTEAGLGVTLAANGEEALAYLAKERPDVVVSDVIMPDKSGYEVCAFVRGNVTLASTPVLLISGIVNHEVIKQAESCRADGVLKKPFQGTSLKDRVLELIAKGQGAAPGAVAGHVSVSQASVGEPTIQMADRQQQGLHQEVRIPKEVEDELRMERTRSEELTKRLSESLEQIARAKTSEVELVAERARANDLQETLAKVEQQVARIPELEAALKVERTRSEELTKRLSESLEQVARAKTSEVELVAERARANDLQETLAKVEQQVARIPELEAALKAEQDAVGVFKQEVVHWQKASDRVAELESALHAERTAAEQLVQQLTELEQISTRTREMEAGLANAEQQTAELHQKLQGLEAELSTERRKGEEAAGHLQELERVAIKIPEIEGLLAAERDRNGMLTRRVADAEQAAESATKRLEEMAHKLGEIASLASQLGNGRGQSGST
ncbi:response regulator [Candidatus Nitrospira nitrificans]|uniref:Putative Response regulator n=1 Tax=Candidatus Nitrospira nitrificans TaxID=1742973 RepID=A0A0S4LSJ7_9BACT|nr:response regulator [Candidatus Nitrospira nitrificans]CUS39012.1 putative Response regulator [Candidatus Nitrospira nitrificans]